MSDSQLPIALESLLRDSGVSEREIRHAQLSTRIYHDLGLYGDTAWWFAEELGKRIDMSSFCFEHYFPPEFYGEGALARFFYAMVPFTSWIRRKKDEYTPVTLSMILHFMNEGRWECMPPKSSGLHPATPLNPPP
jgi:hypothetical protein